MLVKLSHYVLVWWKITKNTNILNWIKGYKIPFQATPYQVAPPTWKLPRTQNTALAEVVS